MVWVILAASCAWMHTPITPQAAARHSVVKAELGFHFNLGASIGPVFALSGYAALQLKLRTTTAARRERDATLKAARAAKAALLVGKLSLADVEQAEAAAREAAEVYDATRLILALPGTLIRIPDPSAGSDGPALDLQKVENEIWDQPPPLASESKQQPSSDDPLLGIRSFLGLQDPQAPVQPQTSLLPTGAGMPTLKDVAIGFVFVLQIGWLLLSFTDPLAAPGQNSLLNVALSAGGEAVDRMEERKRAESEEYAAMLQAAVDAGEAPPACATRKIGDPEGGCANVLAPRLPEDAREFERTRGLDANREWIAGPAPR